MATGFLTDWHQPQHTVVEPRATIRLSWSFYNDIPNQVLQYWQVAWKDASVSQWPTGSYSSVIVPPGNQWYDLPPNTWALDSAMVWDVRAVMLDIDVVPVILPGNPGYGTEGISVALSGPMPVDCSGWVLASEEDKVLPSSANHTVTLQHLPNKPAEPGLYYVRIAGRNGFQWTDWSDLSTANMFDTRKFVKKVLPTGFTAVPTWKKTDGVWKEVIT